MHGDPLQIEILRTQRIVACHGEADRPVLIACDEIAEMSIGKRCTMLLFRPPPDERFVTGTALAGHDERDVFGFCVAQHDGRARGSHRLSSITSNVDSCTGYGNSMRARLEPIAVRTPAASSGVAWAPA